MHVLRQNSNKQTNTNQQTKQKKNCQMSSKIFSVSPSSCSLRGKAESFSLGRAYYSNVPLDHFLEYLVTELTFEIASSAPDVFWGETLIYHNNTYNNDTYIPAEYDWGKMNNRFMQTTLDVDTTWFILSLQWPREFVFPSYSWGDWGLESMSSWSKKVANKMEELEFEPGSLLSQYSVKECFIFSLVWILYWG